VANFIPNDESFMGIFLSVALGFSLLRIVARERGEVFSFDIPIVWTVAIRSCQVQIATRGKVKRSKQRGHLRLLRGHITADSRLVKWSLRDVAILEILFNERRSVKN
jgi:hypothetical protein